MGNDITDFRNIDKTKLHDIGSVTIDAKLSKEERIKSFVNQIGNPYCYLDGDVVVSISYANTETSLEDRLKSYTNGLANF